MGVGYNKKKQSKYIYMTQMVTSKEKYKDGLDGIINKCNVILYDIYRHTKKI